MCREALSLLIMVALANWVVYFGLRFFYLQMSRSQSGQGSRLTLLLMDTLDELLLFLIKVYPSVQLG